MKFDRIKQASTKVDRKVGLFIALGAVVVGGAITSLPAQDQSSAPDAVRERPSAATKPVSGDAAAEAKPETRSAADDHEKASPVTNPATQPVGVTTQPTFPAVQPATTQPAADPATAPSTQPLATAPSANLPQTNPATSPVASSSPRSFDSGSRTDRNDRSRGNDRRSDGRSDRSDNHSATATSPADGIVIPPTRLMDKKFEGLLARSLFSKRRPMSAEDVDRINNRPPPGPVVPPVQLSPEGGMALRGVSIEDNGDKYAFIEDTTTRQILRIKAGSKVARGTILEVTLVDLVYDLDGKRKRITTGQTLEGTPAPANTWTTYQPVASAVPPGGGQQQQSFGDGRNGGRGDGRNGDFGRGGRDGFSQQPQPGVPVSTPAPGVTPAAPTTSPAAPTTAPSGASEESIIERMRRARQEGGR